MTRTSLPAVSVILASFIAACGGDEESLFEGGKGGTSSAGQGHGGGASGQAGTSLGGQGEGGQSSQGGAAGFGGGQGGAGGWSGSSGYGGYAGSYGGYAGSYGGAAGSYGGYGGGAGCAIDPVIPPTGGACVQTGAPGYQCNPITNSPCAAGEACDFDGARFVCFPGSNTQTACGTCSTSQGPFCVGGFTCEGGTGKCTRYCCANADCAPGTSCVMQPPTVLGICQAASTTELGSFQPGSGGNGGFGGSGGYGGGYGGSSGTGGSGGSTTACAHGPCQVGPALDMNCDACVQMLCMFQGSCCSTTWDSSCVSLAQQLCACVP